MNATEKNKIALVPGSFDPITAGHIDVIERAAKLFDKVIVAILVNPEKIEAALFTFEQRKKIAEIGCSHIPNVKVITYEGMLWQLAQMLNICAIVKGIRNGNDFEYEQKMAVFNHEHNPDALTIYLPSYGNMCHVSSTKVRERIKQGDFPDDILTPEISSAIKIIMSEHD